MDPRFPIYIITYKRWDSRLTVKALEKLKVPYYLVVDDFDYDSYAAVVDEKKILVLPKKYRENYDMFWKDDSKKTGSGPARNFVWDHSVENGDEYHWIMDDNIDMFLRLYHNRKYPVSSGTIFRVMEDFVLRYENIALAGPNYDYFCPAHSKLPPVVFNTRIFSCLLIKNDIPFRWRGRYNEDVDLSIRVLKSGLCTVQFNAFMQGKTPTQQLKGGNMTEFYAKEGTYKKSKMLYDMHPDITKITWRFGRCHHLVDYRQFRKNKLKRKSDLNIPKENNEYGMKLSLIENRQNVKQA